MMPTGMKLGEAMSVINPSSIQGYDDFSALWRRELQRITDRWYRQPKQAWRRTNSKRRQTGMRRTRRHK
jgi:hypothetical protein